MVRQGALSQREQAFSTTCEYRSPNRARACGVGQLIDDDLYKRSMEGAAIRLAWGNHHHAGHDLAALALCFSGVNVCDPKTHKLLCAIQEAHDRADDMGAFLQSARELARRRRLTFPTLPEAS